MKSWEIGENREPGLAFLCFSEQAFPNAFERGVFFRDFNDADERYLGTIGYQLDAGFSHARAAHAEQVDVPALAQCRRESRRVHVA
jgi:hypothetical protein